MYRCGMALAVSLVCGHVIGFRFYGSVGATIGFCLLVLLIGAMLSLLGDLIGAATENPEATMPLMLLPIIVFGQVSVGLNRSNASLSGFRRSFATNRYPSSSTRYGRWRRQHTGGRRRDVVGRRTCSGLGGGPERGPAAAACARRGQAAMMSVTAVSDVGAATPRQPGPPARRDSWESSPRRLLQHSWILTTRVLRRWSRDPATVLESLIMPVALLVTLNTVLGKGISEATGTARSTAASR